MFKLFQFDLATAAKAVHGYLRLKRHLVFLRIADLKRLEASFAPFIQYLPSVMELD